MKRDFFGRIIEEKPVDAQEARETREGNSGKESEGKVFVSFHEGYSNAVRKPITLVDLMRDL